MSRDEIEKRHIRSPLAYAKGDAARPAIRSIGIHTSATVGLVGLPFPRLVVVDADQVDTSVRAVGERVLALVQRRLKLKDLKWYHHCWLLPYKAYSKAMIESWGTAWTTRPPTIGRSQSPT